MAGITWFQGRFWIVRIWQQHALGESWAARSARSGMWGLLICLAVVACGLLPRSRASESEGPARLVSEGATVVLLTGIPGDVESETRYHDELQGWLDLVAGEGRAAKVYLLCDNPESIGLPPGVGGRVEKGDRKNFVELGEALSAEKQPMLVVAWGHGGKQGQTPVLHVRGPRLTPADFGAFAAKAAAPRSQWLLLFRGSGAFAGQLVSTNADVISSDFETMFSSDSVGMPLALKIAKASPTISFSAFATELGRATEAWYRERRLAQTEEPTLWTLGAKPRLLAVRGSGAGEFASVEAEQKDDAGGATLDGGDARQPSGPGNTEAAPGAIPAWTKLQKVRPDQYPEADGVVLSRRLSCLLGALPAISTEQETVIQILKPEGKQFGDFDISFAPPHEEVEILDCEVLRPDGKVERLDTDTIGEAREHAPGDYETQRRKVFSVPGIVPGALLHVRHRTQWKEFPLPHISMELPIGHELPVIDAAIQISVPKDSAFHFAFERISAPDPEIKHSAYGTSYSWRLANIPAHRKEILSPRGQTPRLMFSTFPDWKAFAEWYQRITRLTDEVTPEIAAKARELTASATTDRERILALYDYVTALRYVAVPLGVNSVRPHSAAAVFRNQFGDCKDKANLLNTLLHALNIEANLVLVPRFSQALEAVPGFAFNHAISQVKAAGQFLWLDTTDDICRFGLLPPGDPERKVLVIDGQTSHLTQLPPPDPEQNQLTVTGRIDWAQAGGGMPAEFGVVAVGYPDYELRTTARHATENQASMPLLAASFRPVSGSFALAKQRSTSLSSMREDFSWQAQGHCFGLVSIAGSNAALRSPFWLPRQWDLALHQRTAPLFLNEGYPLALKQDFQISIPRGSRLVAIPDLCENNRGPLRWRIRWAKVGDDQLTAHFSAELVRGELSASDTLLVQEQMRSLFAAVGSEAALALPP
jgi:uncharacterized protein DUF3857/transglutaminase superfamily protein